MIDPWKKAEECGRALATCADRERRQVLANLRVLTNAAAAGHLRRNEVRRATSLALEHLQRRALAKTSEHVPEFHDLPATWTRARLECVGALCRLRFVRRRLNSVSG
jgi:hypothetical protein